MFKAKKTSDAVSPVIGVILLVAVTVALVALATVIVFDIGSDVSDSADATVQLNGVTADTADTGIEGSEGAGDNPGVQATIIRNGNVDQLDLSGPETRLEIVDSEVGDSLTIVDGEGSYSVIATLPDGGEEVLTSTER